mmetsp:Transcript_33197/g.100143  ORF Transcript_33197/g.100143 Transcript_33197/m.100143 type:complete len:282 (+) Transcript_33197:218-1063(+)
MTSRAASHGADEEREGFLANGVPDWTALPPPPTPSSHQRRESRLGCGVVVSIVGACIAGARAARAMLACAPDHLVRRWVLPLVYAEAAVAFACLAGLLWGDPGTIKRSTATCAPIPAAVLARLRAGEAAAEKRGQNITGDDGRVYCVRCLVWRPPRGAHHCSTCQRCVADFDHHCGVFGRCVAGSGWRGNMKYFVGIIAAGYAGGGTAGAALVVGAIECGRRAWWGTWTNAMVFGLGAYAGLAAAAWVVVTACQCVGAFYDCVESRLRPPARVPARVFEMA